MGARKLVVEIDAETEAALARSADERHVPIEQVAAEAIVLHTLSEPPAELPPWSAEDLAAIEEGFAQLDRGESFTQEEVDAKIDALLR
jgi:predicted transcriptional regulator